ncbi:MAG: ADP-ribosylglycohydrolase family protein [bacterium]|nr:ADP-ribosylglycohydrolase family protein [bacterium]
MLIDTVSNKIEGCLLGAVIGTELGIRNILSEERLSPKMATEALKQRLTWKEILPQHPKRIGFTSLTPLIQNVARTYIKKDGRITPEDWALELMNDPNITENKAFWLIDIHSTIELLKEGMNPRISGLGATPTGNICVGIIPVGIYHIGDPEIAYLDGIEIASVTQRSPAVDWAALTASAIAEALKPEATVDSVIDIVLKLSHRNNKDIFYEINNLVNIAKRTQEDFINVFPYSNRFEKDQWLGHNPIGWALALLSAFEGDSERLMTISVLLDAFPSIRSSVVGAILGALKGIKTFPKDWIEKASPILEPMLGIKDVIEKKLEKEQIVIKEIDKLVHIEKDNKNLLFDKIYGCLLAGAIGNAMGSVVEGLFYWEIDERYPGGVKTILDPSRLEGEDDNQMAALLIETYIEREGLPASARDFGDMWRRRLNRDHFFYCMRNSYELIRKGIDPRITGHWNIVTGSTVMCMEPVGIYHLCDPINAYIDATSISYMYQRGLDVVSASILAASVAEALKPDATVDSILKTVLEVAPKTKMITFDRREIDTPYDFLKLCIDIASKYNDVFEVRKELYEKCLYYHMIDPLELLGLAYAIFKVAKGDVRLSAIGGTNIGRDSDTIAGRAAMLSGALNGVSNVPSEWIGLFKPSSLERIRNNAFRVAKLIEERKLPYICARQAFYAIPEAILEVQNEQ